MNTRFVFRLTRFALGPLLLCGLVLGGVSPASADVGRCYVNASAGGANSGASWVDAYTDLQSALGDSSCTEIWVARGTYRPTLAIDPTDNRTKTFMLKSGVALYGGFAGTEVALQEGDPAANLTILSGDIGILGDPSDNSYHVVVGSATDSTALLDGFTVAAGNADGAFPHDRGAGMYSESGSPSLIDVIFTGNSAGGYGGGMYIEYNSNPSLVRVTFSNNMAANCGGGMFNGSGSNPTLTDVTFSSNSATNDGGGMFNYYSSPTLTNVTFSGNSSASGGGGISNLFSSPSLTNVTLDSNSASLSGGGISNVSSGPSLTNVTFDSNSATYYGGGISNVSSSPSLTDVTFSGNAGQSGGGMYNERGSPSLTNVTFNGNSASYGGGGMYNYWSSNPSLTNVTFFANRANDGSGMYNQQSSPQLTNVTFTGNGAYNYGGGMYNEKSSPTLTNVTFSGNPANSGGGIYNFNSSSPTITNSILFYDAGGEIVNDTSSNATVSYSLVSGGYPGTGNLNAADPGLGLFSYNGGFTWTVPLLPGSPAIDAGSNAFCPSTDQRGVARPQGAACDMGAFEVQGTAPAITSANHTSFAVGSAGSFSVTTTGDPTPTITESGSLPSGVTFTDNGDGTATLAGTPGGTGGYYSLTITASNGIGPDATQSFTLTVQPTIALSALPNGTLKAAYNQPITASGGTAPYSFSMTGGSLPTGLSLSAGGTLSGTPSAVGPFNFTVTATDANNFIGSRAYSMGILYKFTGFYSPVLAPNKLNAVSAGSSVPFKFNLAGYQGMSILAAGAPASQQISCTTFAPSGSILATSASGMNGLAFDGSAYVYVWKTALGWKGTCRQFILTLNDGTVHVAFFKFK